MTQYGVRRGRDGWYAVGVAAGPFRTQREAEEAAEELSVAAGNAARIRAAKPSLGGSLAAMTVGTVLTGVLLGLTGAAGYWVFRLVTGV